MNDNLSIKSLLDDGSAKLSYATQYKLAQRRQAVLMQFNRKTMGHQSQKNGSSLSLVSSFADNFLSFLPILVAISLVFVMSYKQHDQYIAESADLETELFASETPIEAYTDSGFAHWLHSQSAQTASTDADSVIQ
jgi:Protein of unknown function (DUF3619)